MKRMACILDENTALERVVCPVCRKTHHIETDALEYLDKAKNGPAIGRYQGWDNAMELLCDQCTSGAEFFFGKEIVLSLLKEGDLEAVELMAKVVVAIRDHFEKGVTRLNGATMKTFIESQTFDSGHLRFLWGNWEMVRPEEHLKQFGIRPVRMGIVADGIRG